MFFVVDSYANFSKPGMDDSGTIRDLARSKRDDMNFCVEVDGRSMCEGDRLCQFIKSYRTIGFQATNISLGIDEINKMRGSKIFFGCTSNIISSGLRDIVAHIARYKLVDVMVITGGGVEEDIIKTLTPHKIASFDLKGKDLRENGLNRIGNLVVQNESYFEFEKWMTDVLDDLLKTHTDANPLVLTPSSFIKALGQRVTCEGSVLHWCSKNSIPVYSPAITDGSIGDILTFCKKRSMLKLDIVEDIYNMNKEAMFESSTGAIVLGGGLVKHHILNANLFKNGLDHCVLVNTSGGYDGSDTGGNIDEAVSWGKIKAENTSVKIFGDATLVFPLLFGGSFLSGKSRDSF